MTDIKTTRLESLEIGAAPLVQALIDRLGLEELLTASLPKRRRGRPAQLAPAKALCVMTANVLLSRMALYAVPGWLGGYVPECFGLSSGQLRFLNDDRIGRNLDLLFRANHASLTTTLVLGAVRIFDVELSELHNDSTSITFSGRYNHQSANGPAPLIALGHNKDHRPDLKQLVYSLSVAADGAVPIHFKIYDGNITDDQTHIETWTSLCALVGRSRLHLCRRLQAVRQCHDEAHRGPARNVPDPAAGNPEGRAVVQDRVSARAPDRLARGPARSWSTAKRRAGQRL